VQWNQLCSNRQVFRFSRGLGVAEQLSFCGNITLYLFFERDGTGVGALVLK